MGHSNHLLATCGSLGPVCRLGLAARTDALLDESDYHHALDQGIDFFNWPGTPDAMSRTIARLGARRREVKVCTQFEARTAAQAETELASQLRELGTDYLDVLTFYYVEERSEWDEITGPGGALEVGRRAQQAGKVRRLGLTSHQRPLAADIARSGLIDLLMIRYNAAHRGAETEIFPTTTAMGLPVVAYTNLRWGALLRATPDDPPGFAPPSAPWWYRFVLANPAVTVALMAPHDRRELDEDLTVLSSPTLTPAEIAMLAEHGARVRRHAGAFP